MKHTPTGLTLRPPVHRVDRRAIVLWISHGLIFTVVVLGLLLTGYGFFEPARRWLLPPIIVAGVVGGLGTFAEPWIRFALLSAAAPSVARSSSSAGAAITASSTARAIAGGWRGEISSARPVGAISDPAPVGSITRRDRRTTATATSP